MLNCKHTYMHDPLGGHIRIESYYYSSYLLHFRVILHIQYIETIHSYDIQASTQSGISFIQIIVQGVHKRLFSCLVNVTQKPILHTGRKHSYTCSTFGWQIIRARPGQSGRASQGGGGRCRLSCRQYSQWNQLRR
jgi:hypothetical protein